MTTKLNLIAAALTAGVVVLGVTQIASAKTAPTTALPNVSSTLAQAQPADIAETGDTPDVAGTAETADTAEAGDVTEPAGKADTDQVQDSDQMQDSDQVQDSDRSGPETPDAPGSTR